MKRQKENSHENITWSEMGNKTCNLETSIQLPIFLCILFFFLFSRIANKNVSLLHVTLNISVSGKDLAGQGFSLHQCVIKPSPWQSSPPWVGGGLVQVLPRVWTPRPQVTGQVLQGFQLAQPPSTLFCQVAKKRKINYSDLSLLSCFFLKLGLH